MLCHRPAQAAGNPGCVDGNDSLSVSARDVCGSSDAAIPAAASLSPSRPLMWPSELSGAVATSISLIQVHRETNRSVTNFEDALEHDTHPYREARHAEDQASRCLGCSKYTDQEFRGGIRDLRVLAELGSRGE